ncbi:hypothetical protein LZK98_15795 [Sphingomonas cannabina]|uniref:hypothetical protein n=1 Tax=Sphingomonas cannabina TaxID=2899123 RepID=UPI001F29D678|nr:hypothetical protein [Sphingomonas cannabina]UIJ44512.1 hypothetical protein LZK98_15795 [Sphingomonas cannabina]
MSIRPGTIAGGLPHSGALRRKVWSERRHRPAGEVVAADFTLRQLTHIELILDCSGRGLALIDAWTRRPGLYGDTEALFASPISSHLEEIRRAVWEELGDPPRPPLPLDAKLPHAALSGGPTNVERRKARRDAERRIAEAQREWEAAAREDSWEAWKMGRGG